MSRPTWKCRVELTLVNGQQGSIVLEAKDLLTVGEIKQQFNKALSIAETLKAEPAEEARPGFRVVG